MRLPGRFRIIPFIFSLSEEIEIKELFSRIQGAVSCRHVGLIVCGAEPHYLLPCTDYSRVRAVRGATHQDCVHVNTPFLLPVYFMK